MQIFFHHASLCTRTLHFVVVILRSISALYNVVTVYVNTIFVPDLEPTSLDPHMILCILLLLLFHFYIFVAHT